MARIKVKIKEEFDEKFSIQCRTCLSIGRKMVPVGDFVNTYRCLTSEYEFVASMLTQQSLLCWECHSLLRKVQRFQSQVQKANEILSFGQERLASEQMQLFRRRDQLTSPDVN